MSEISTIIRQFLEDQKADFLAKRISQETRDKKIKYDQLLEKQKSTENENDKLVMRLFQKLELNFNLKLMKNMKSHRGLRRYLVK